jgi:hypothetical protein
MNEIENAPLTIIDEFIEALIQNTSDGSQYWRVDTNNKNLRYYYNTGQNAMIFITQDQSTPKGSTFSLRMAYGDNLEQDTLIACEYAIHHNPCQLRELWLAAQGNIMEEECNDFDLMGYAKAYTAEVKRKNMFDELFQILVTASDEIVELFKNKTNK